MPYNSLIDEDRLLHALHGWRRRRRWRRKSLHAHSFSDIQTDSQAVTSITLPVVFAAASQSQSDPVFQSAFPGRRSPISLSASDVTNTSIIMSDEQEVTSKRIPIDGYDVYCEIRGSGQHVILFLPGAMGTCTTDFLQQYRGFDHSRFTMVSDYFVRLLLYNGD